MKHLHFLFKSALGAALLSAHPAYTHDFGVFAWGLNSSGQLGLGSDLSHGLPRAIEELQQSHVKAVHTSGHCHASVAVSDSGSVYTWGNGLDGLLGHDDTDANLLIPTLVEQLDGVAVSKVACGGGHMAALDSAG